MRNQAVSFRSNHRPIKRRITVAFLLVIASLLLVSCGPGGLQQITCRMIEVNSEANSEAKIKCYLSEIAWFAARLPIIGPFLEEQLLSKMPSKEHWKIGIGIIGFLFILLRSFNSSD